MLRDFYKGKKVLITGQTGFKGAWLTIWLKSLGAEVAGIGLDPVSELNLFELSGIGKHITDYRQDIRNLAKVKEIFQAEKPDILPCTVGQCTPVIFLAVACGMLQINVRTPF